MQKKMAYELERRWLSGIFLEIVMESTERIVGAADCVYQRCTYTMPTFCMRSEVFRVVHTRQTHENECCQHRSL